MKEIYKDVPNYEGKYQVSNLGNIRSLDRIINTAIKHNTKKIQKGKNITAKNLPYGYQFVFLYNGTNKNGKMFLIHRLVAQAFIPNPENKKEVNHIDGDKKNNSLSNLEWCTRKENKEHAVATGLYPRGEKCNHSKMNDLQVRIIKKCKGMLSGRHLSKVFNISSSNIYDVWGGKIWQHI